MIVDLSVLKLALGIADDDTSEDDLLTDLESRAAAFVEGDTHRRFQAPVATIEFVEGTGTRKLFLAGHIEEDSTAVTIRERTVGGSSSDWEAFTDVEERGDMLLRTDGSVWDRNSEYEISYEDGYNEAPADIQAVVIELVSIGRNATAAATSGATGTETSVTIGEYSYQLDAGAAAAAAASASTLSATGLATLKRWRRARI